MEAEAKAQAHNSNVDYVALLDEELKSCCMPQVKDPGNASTDELIRDLYRVLTGNGGPTHGMVFKVAAANVNIKLLKKDVADMDGKVKAQTRKCEEIQELRATEHAVEQAEKKTVKRIGKAIWDNKALILMFILMAVMYITNLISKGRDNTVAEQKVNQLVEAKIQKMIIGKTLPPLPEKRP